MEQLTERYEHLRRTTRGGVPQRVARAWDDEPADRLGVALARERCRREAAEQELDVLAERLAALEAENLRLRRP